ncbi:MAG: polymer-forming cytoskeletal protein [Aquabacterium sp.]|jgi:cytoskeletal protein CcmA (bactofilin family)|nr:polymer-forming cytoskeletal protein [Aquabacterium sp.]
MATSSSSSSAARTTVIVHPVNERITTMIAAGMCVQGSIEGAEGVYVRGEITGDLLINDDGPPDTGTVVVDKTGIVRGIVSGRRVVVLGTVEGPVIARTALTLGGASVVHGDVYCGQLQPGPGSVIKGQVRTLTAGMDALAVVRAQRGV